MKFRRRKSNDQQQDPDALDPADDLAELATDRPRGPYDRSETTIDSDDGAYVDLGGLVVRGGPSVELRLQVDEQTSAVSAVLLAGPESGLELRAFAAPRSSGIWDDVRRDIAAEAAKHGGTATEVDGEYGTELKVVVPLQLPDGRPGTQASRIVGVEGPRWLLRGTFLGKSVDESDPDAEIESAFRGVIVVRGDGPMKPREMIEMHLPEQAAVTLADDSAGEPDS